MRHPSRRPGVTTRRTGLQATAQIYLKDVDVDDSGFVTGFEIAFLPGWADPDVIREAVRGSINLDEPERIELYDEEDRPLLGHPGSPRRHAARSPLAVVLNHIMRRARPARRAL